ncbi:hypothetical protein Mapa_005048 [Marchantia paleacea]|nr:hypothetical protein Mapa_005048 [Marchantia paleacea]
MGFGVQLREFAHDVVDFAVDVVTSIAEHCPSSTLLPEPVTQSKVQETRESVAPNVPVQTESYAESVQKRVTLSSLLYAAYSIHENRPDCSHVWKSEGYEKVNVEDILSKDNLRKYHKEIEKEERRKHIAVFQRPGQKHAARPPWVIAVRGTAMNHMSGMHDIWDDLKIITQRLHRTTLVRLLEAVVLNLANQVGYEQICVTGHSLGAAAGMLVCRKIALTEHNGYHIDAHLFNPPFASVEILFRQFVDAGVGVPTWLLGKMVLVPKLVTPTLYFLKYCVTIGAGQAKKIAQAHEEYVNLANWTPTLYLNPHDPICREYVTHFQKTRLGTTIDNLVHPESFSVGALVLQRVMGQRRVQAFNLFPSAIICVTKAHTRRHHFMRAHSLQNWQDTSLKVDVRHHALIAELRKKVKARRDVPRCVPGLLSRSAPEQDDFEHVFTYNIEVSGDELPDAGDYDHEFGETVSRSFESGSSTSSDPTFDNDAWEYVDLPCRPEGSCIESQDRSIFKSLNGSAGAEPNGDGSSHQYTHAEFVGTQTIYSHTSVQSGIEDPQPFVYAETSQVHLQVVSEHPQPYYGNPYYRQGYGLPHPPTVHPYANPVTMAYPPLSFQASHIQYQACPAPYYPGPYYPGEPCQTWNVASSCGPMGSLPVADPYVAFKMSPESTVDHFEPGEAEPGDLSISYSELKDETAESLSREILDGSSGAVCYQVTFEGEEYFTISSRSPGYPSFS